MPVEIALKPRVIDTEPLDEFDYIILGYHLVGTKNEKNNPFSCGAYCELHINSFDRCNTYKLTNTKGWCVLGPHSIFKPSKEKKL